MAQMPQGPVKIIVGGVIGMGLVTAIFFILPVWWFAFALSLLAVEAWSFFNMYQGDTISEVVWALSERPLVPLMFGVGVGWAITAGQIPSTTEGLWVTLCLGTLLGHFFWRPQGDAVEAAVKTLAKAEDDVVDKALKVQQTSTDVLSTVSTSPVVALGNQLPDTVEVAGNVTGTLKVNE